jgi:hypothetical protein
MIPFEPEREEEPKKKIMKRWDETFYVYKKRIKRSKKVS